MFASYCLRHCFTIVQTCKIDTGYSSIGTWDGAKFCFKKATYEASIEIICISSTNSQWCTNFFLWFYCRAKWLMRLFFVSGREKKCWILQWGIVEWICKCSAIQRAFLEPHSLLHTPYCLEDISRHHIKQSDSKDKRGLCPFFKCLQKVPCVPVKHTTCRTPYSRLHYFAQTPCLEYSFR